ncbi:ABC transporter substrate-binding protein [Pontibacillus marinus]|uniref:ABC transporter substrate-binding protein n=1 Tax=Pontibacillus marinus BH030004 = DSM 16465 TaxID=1385511 RepID=A0A0A5FX69_9BACI|nr:ABC transporter substrate-binding protein [Pontibacillus marinus BH030004 = DSM 16465]
MKKWLLMVSALLVVAMVGCSSDSEANGDGGDGGDAKYQIGVTQIVEHPSLDAAQEGFKAAINDAGLDANFDVQVAQDPKNNKPIAEKFVGNDVDLIFANSTPSAQSVLNETKDIPIVFTSVTDPVGANLVESMEKPGGNVTGTSDTHPEAMQKTLSFMTEEVGVETIGMIYNAGEQNSVSQVEKVKELTDGSVEVKEATVSSSAEVKQAAESLAGKVDAFYIITDNTVVSALESVLLVGQDQKTPVFVAELDSVKRGGVAAYGFDYYDIGYEAGEKAVKILEEGKKPGDIPATYPQNLKLLINKDAAKKMGLEIKDEWKDMAEFTEGEE